jgi:hypothetical protein
MTVVVQTKSAFDIVLVDVSVVVVVVVVVAVVDSIDPLLAVPDETFQTLLHCAQEGEEVEGGVVEAATTWCFGPTLQ